MRLRLIVLLLQIWRVQLVNMCEDIYLYQGQAFINSYPEYKKDFQSIKGIKNYIVLLVVGRIQAHSFVRLQEICNKKKVIIVMQKHTTLQLYINDFFTDIRFYLYESSFLSVFFSLYGNGNCQYHLHVFLLGRYAKAIIRGAYLATNDQIVTLRTDQAHIVPDTSSEVIINGVAAQNSDITYTGAISISQQAAQSKALQKNSNIVVGKYVSVDARPQMEVLNNDVQCCHGCAVGVLDEKQLFYLQTRGFKREEAKRLLIKGFLCEAVQVVDDLVLKERFNKKLRDLLDL